MRATASRCTSTVNRAEKAVIDAVQSGNVPRTCNSEGAVALNVAFGRRISARAQAILDAADEEETATGRPPPEPPPDLTPLQNNQQCVGRRVLVPHALWPTYPCDENGARGWTAHIFSYSRDIAKLRFASACDDRGLPYPDELLQIGDIVPI